MRLDDDHWRLGGRTSEHPNSETEDWNLYFDILTIMTPEILPTWALNERLMVMNKKEGVLSYILVHKQGQVGFGMTVKGFRCMR